MSENIIKIADLTVDGDELSDDELAAVTGGMPPRGGYSKTIVIDPGYTDVDAGF
jgi:putative ATP-grasp target RiPP